MAGNLKALPTPPSPRGHMTMQLLGQYVKARRTQAGLRIDDAADLCGISKDTLSRIENGKETVQVGSLLRVMQQLGIICRIEPWENS